MSDAIATDNGTAIIKVLEKAGSDAGGLRRPTRTRSATELLDDRRNRFFCAYMVKAKQKMKIEVNREALQRAASSRQPRRHAGHEDTKPSCASWFFDAFEPS